MNSWAERLIDQETADKVGKCWGLGSGTTKDPGPWEGELRNMWKPTAQEVRKPAFLCLHSFCLHLSMLAVELPWNESQQRIHNADRGFLPFQRISGFTAGISTNPGTSRSSSPCSSKHARRGWTWRCTRPRPSTISSDSGRRAESVGSDGCCCCMLA